MGQFPLVPHLSPVHGGGGGGGIGCGGPAGLRRLVVMRKQQQS